MNKSGFFLISIILLHQVVFAAGVISNKEEGRLFLEKNALKEGVVTLESGLQYKILIESEGSRPLATDRVEVYYHGFLLNGREFDGTAIIRPPIVFNVNRLIKGWTEVLQLMPVGSIWEVYVPSHLAYGEKGKGKKIPSNSTLIFELELVDIL